MYSIVQRLLFLYVTPLIRIGRQRPLTSEDAPQLPDNLVPSAANESFEYIQTDTFTRFIFGVFFATGKPARMLGILTLVKNAVTLTTPILLHNLLTRFTDPSFDLTSTLLVASGLGTAGLVGATIMQHWYYNALQASAIITNGINRRVVRHALRLRRSSRATMNTGDLVNHLASDTEAVAEVSFIIPEMTNSIISVVAVMSMLVYYLGTAAFAALGALLLMMPLTFLVARRFRRLDHEIMDIRDRRVTLMSQILQGIRVVKYYAWEKSVGSEVQDTRNSEIHTKVRVVRTDAMSTVLFISTTTVIAFAGFGAYTINGAQLSAPVIFACLALFGMLEEPFGMFSHLLANLQHARVATERLHKYFGAPTRSNDDRAVSMPGQPIGLTAHDISLRYSDAAGDAVSNGSLIVKPGESIAIIGAVGSGKSTLLRILASVQLPTSGTLDYTGIEPAVRPRSAYVPQEAFIMNASIIDNIIFGEAIGKEHVERLSSSVFAAALEQDLASMPAGLDTEIGERGVNLSGGQKQRVALARAAYVQPGIVFLDDPLSAVDVHTEEFLVDNLLFGKWKDITRIVVTHRIDHLHRFDNVYVMRNGVLERTTATSPEARETIEHYQHAVDTPMQVQAGAAKFMDDEDRETGAVKSDVYWHYVRAMIGRHPVLSKMVFLALLATVASITVLPMLQTSWLGSWTDAISSNHASSTGHTSSIWESWFGLIPSAMGSSQAISIYGVIGVVVLLAWLLERLLWLQRSAIAAQSIHNHALAGVLAAPLRFFDRTPIGRVLNRFARDTEAVDDHLSWNFEQSFKSLSQTLGSMILVLAVLPLLIVVMIPVLIVYYMMQRDYRASAREAKRLESTSRSPRYAHFKELVTGLDVIHGFGRERVFMQTFYANLENYQRAFWCSILLNRWFSIRVPLISGVVSLATCIGVVILIQQGTLTPGKAGVVLTFALGFWMNLNWTVRSFSEVESRMTSVERLRNYGQMESEPQTVRQPAVVSDTWPISGSIRIHKLNVRYADDLPLVLKDICFSVGGGQKVGIIGRTGSGKSTLFQSLFRFVEAESGTIEIDGVDIASVPLARLRKAIAIIPQDPTLFIGTVRKNIDRFDECTDEEVWAALRRVQMHHVIDALPGRLSAVVVENGHNFSQGQRQLLCMARAILTHARIIVLDEATASVDIETDATIQKTIREEFKGVTVLVIAHRLDTVQDMDHIVELAAGRVV